MQHEETSGIAKKDGTSSQLAKQIFFKETRKTYFRAEKQTHKKVRDESTEENLSLQEQKLKKSEALQSAILQALPGVKFLLSNEGMFLHCYEGRENENFVFETSELPGKKLTEIFPPYIAQAILSNIKKTIETNVVQKFECIIPKNGAMVYYEVRINLVSQNEVIAIFNDISEIKKAQEVLKEHLNELDEKNRQLKKYIDSNLQLENFAYIASHDLREPLRTIRNFAELLKNRYAHQLDESAINHINLIVNGASQMNNLVEDLLTYSRVNTENHSIEPINSKELLNEVLFGLESYIRETGAKVKIKELPKVIYANPTKMKQLFLNLITNAIKFRKPEVPSKVILSMKDFGDYWKISVADNGIGIRKEFQKQIFMLFKKLHSNGEHPGTGLGLAICQKIIEQHQGNIWVESDEGQGTVFCCTIKKGLKNEEEA